MSAPVINIQEAAALYVRIMKANPDSFSQRVKSIPPYKTTVLIHQDVIGGKMYSFIQKVTFSDGIIEKDYKLRIKVEDFKITMSKSQGGAFKC